MYDASIPLVHWVDTLLTTTHLINLLPSPQTKNLSPYQLLHRRPPDYSYLRIYGCACYPLLPPHHYNKLQARSKPCIFLGYSLNSKGYKCFDPTTGRIILSRHTMFDENTFPFQTYPLTNSNPPPNSTTPYIPPPLLQPLLPPSPNVTNSPTNHTTTTHDTSTEPTQPNPPAEQPVTPQPLPLTLQLNTHPMLTQTKTGSTRPKSIFNLQCSTVPTDPHSYSQASKHLPWRQAMSQEFQALTNQGTWSLVPPPTDQTWQPMDISHQVPPQ